jgi:hypothetical protein
MAISAFCNLCGRPTRGQYHVYRRLGSNLNKGLVVCQHCEREARRCAICRIPINPVVSLNGLCPTCDAQVPRCAACGQRVQGRYIRNESNGAYYCETCFNHRPRCGVCGGAVGQGGYQLHDGRFICAQCHETAVYDAGKAGDLYEQVTEIMDQQLGMRLNLLPALGLVDRNQMLALLEQMEIDSADDPDRVFGLFFRRGRKRAIYVEYGLPQILMIQVMAHEVAHAWQGENCPLLRDPFVREGFGEWAAYRVLTALGAVKKTVLLEQRADLYGQGLRFMLALERQGGTTAVFQACRNSGIG